VKRLYGPTRKKPEGLLGYNNGAQNYDHEAIRIVGNEFVQNATHANRMMLVLSDGEPWGHRYGGEKAIQQTRDEVQALEKKGVYMMQLAINAAKPEEMFTNYVKFSDERNAITEIGKLLHKFVNKAGREIC
jgi:cell division protein FtsI/penicillin-binding protein 2